MDSKNIKDYLHLYLGCQVLFDDEFLGKLIGMNHWEQPAFNPLIIETDKAVMINRSWAQVKPILRPLSDMTEEEKKDLIKYDKLVQNYNSVKFHDELANDKLVGIVIQYSHTVDEGDWAWECPQTWVLRFSSMNAHDFMWLLSKGFDLFGLIDAGLAIKKSD